MSRPVVWSPASKNEFGEMLDYVEKNFGLDAALDFLEKTDQVIDHISEHPELFPASDKSPAVRKALITQQTSLFYRISAREIQLLHFWDNRRNPDTLAI